MAALPTMWVRFGAHHASPSPALDQMAWCRGQSFEIAFLETVLRDRKNGNPGMPALNEI